MITKRILFTGHSTSHLVRYVTYALELGATVLHIGYRSAFLDNPPAAYTFEPVDDTIIKIVTGAKAYDGAAKELVAREVERWAALAADFAPDVCHSVGADELMQLAGRAGLRPRLVSALGFLENWVYEAPQLKQRELALLECDGLLVEPPMMVEIARQLLPPTVQVEELSIGFEGRHYYPVGATTRAAWRRALKVEADAVLIFSPRGWQPTYGHEYVLAAFAKVLPSLPAPAYLFFTQMARSGSMEIADNYFQQVRRQADELGVADHVRWLPKFPTVSMATLYNAADFIVSYRAPDTFPVTVLEAMACARPVIVSDVPTLANSVITDHCLLVPPQDSDALAVAFTETIHNPPSPDALAAARQAVLACYDKPVVIQKLAAIYDSLATRSPRPMIQNES